MELYSCKFGGNSVKTAENQRHIRDNIVRPDRRRRAITVSALKGATDMLIAWHSFGYPQRERKIRHIMESFSSKDAILAAIEEEHAALVRDLGLSINVQALFNEIRDEYKRLEHSEETEGMYHYAASRGECVNGRIMAELLGYEYIDATKFLVLNGGGEWDAPASHRLAAELQLRDRAVERGIVIGGFHGRSKEAGSVVSLPRGGSDTSGAYLAVLVGADVYENFTDVDGVYTTDPKLFRGCLKNNFMTCDEMYEMADSGASVLHPHAIRPAELAAIPIHLRSTKKFPAEGTWILPRVDYKARNIFPKPITGITERPVVMVRVHKVEMEQGFDERLNIALSSLGFSFNHKFTGTDYIMVAIPQEQLEGKEPKVTQVVEEHCGSVVVEFLNGFHSVSVVGEGTRRKVGFSGKLFAAIGGAGVYDEAISKGASPITTTFVVTRQQLHDAIAAVHRTFF